MVCAMIDASVERPTILFLHVPKTAGTTVAFALMDNFADEQRLLYQGIDQVERLGESVRRQLRFVRGHFAYGLHELFPQPCEYITVLREPVDRLLSLYGYIKRKPAHPLHEWMNKEDVSFEEFLDSKVTIELDNHQTRMLSASKSPFGQMSQNEMMLAIRHLEQCAVVGIQDRLEDFIEIVSRRYGLKIAPCGSQLVAPRRLRADELEPSVYEKAVALCQYDNEVYSHAVALSKIAVMMLR